MKPFLLLQARDHDDPMAEHEWQSFARAMGVTRDEIHTWNLIEGSPDADTLNRHAAVLIGGSGAYSASGEQQWVHDAAQLIREELVGRGRKTFGVCFGLQLMGRALGEDVIHDPENREVGTYEVVVTAEAQECELFGVLPPSFFAQQGHNDRILNTPVGTKKLAESALAEVQALVVEDKPVWATQFHPELDIHGNRLRYMRYIENYGGLVGPESEDPVLTSLRPSPHATNLLYRFARMVLEGRDQL
ncbi:MAG: type 1 glutamine amidotransferase [Myxococcales bacterium]|nr:type 1 glutamine amidotransferase [Myxococcales bacterium]